uniref:hypothetical protein n=1 Tax=Aeromonas caviae TaxID=648 RepID=UPI002B4A5FBF
WIPCLLSRGMAMAQRRCSTIGISYLDSKNNANSNLLTIFATLPEDEQRRLLLSLHNNIG